jgi:hypothetical protein
VNHGGNLLLNGQTNILHWRLLLANSNEIG